MITLPDDFEVQPLDSIPRMAEEAKHQAVLVAALRRHWSVLDRTARPIVFHLPMGGSRNAAEGANLKTQGALAGVPDLCIVLPLGKVVWVEMKAQSGKLSQTQTLLHDHFRELGHSVITAFSVFDALDQLRKRLCK